MPRFSSRRHFDVAFNQYSFVLTHGLGYAQGVPWRVALTLHGPLCTTPGPILIRHAYSTAVPHFFVELASIIQRSNEHSRLDSTSELFFSVGLKRLHTRKFFGYVADHKGPRRRSATSIHSSRKLLHQRALKHCRVLVQLRRKTSV